MLVGVAHLAHLVGQGLLQLQILEFPPAVDSHLVPLLFLPALGTPIEYYEPLLTAWSAHGRRVFGMQMRGQPHWSPQQLRRNDFGYREIISKDLPAAFDATLWSTPPVLVGHSLGGQLALLATAARTISPPAVVTLAAGTSSIRTGSPAQRTRRSAEIALVRAASRALGYWPGDRLGFGGRQPRTLMRDWSREARTGRYELSSDTTNYTTALKAITQPVLVVDITGDQLVPTPAVDHLADQLPPHHTRRTLTAGAADHFRWARRDPARVIEPVDIWLRSEC